MNLKKILMKIKFKKFTITSIFITVVSIVGFYSFFNHGSVVKVSDETKAPSDINNKNELVQLKSDHTISVGNDFAKILIEKLSTKTNNSLNIVEEELKETLEIFESDDIFGVNENAELQELFKDSVYNKHTVRVAEMVQEKFNDSFDDIDSHCNDVEKYLRNQLDDEAKVEEFLSFYRKYSEYEIAQVNDPQSLWLENPETIEEAIILNNEKQHYQREVFGQEVADILWGDEMKAHEYKMMELDILREDIYSEQVKEQLLEELKEETFEEKNGEQVTAMNDDSKFYIKLAINAEDLMNMTNEERNAKIREFRNEVFLPDKVKMLDAFEKVVYMELNETNN